MSEAPTPAAQATLSRTLQLETVFGIALMADIVLTCMFAVLTYASTKTYHYDLAHHVNPRDDWYYTMAYAAQLCCLLMLLPGLVMTGFVYRAYRRAKRADNS